MEYLVIAALLGLIPAFIAKSKGRENLFGWWLYGALLFIFALIHSLLMKPVVKSEWKENSDGPRRCPKPGCQKIVHGTQENCPYCGTPMDGATLPCPKCAEPMFTNLSVCPSCGYDRVTDPEGLASDERECPRCAEMIKKKANICKHCGSEVEPMV
jgi:RNA polymerase subunit RPABC4/transcription elongation factor Spt4